MMNSPRGITKIYNESPMRQGKPFWHYGKDFETVRRENATFLNRSYFIGAYFENELIGFIKLVYEKNFASMMQIISMMELSRRKLRRTSCSRRQSRFARNKKYRISVLREVFGTRHETRDSLSDLEHHNGFL